MAGVERKSGGEIHLRAAVIAAPEVDPSTGRESLHVLRVGPQRGVEIRLGTVPIAPCEMNLPTLASCPGAVLESDAAVQRRHGFIEAPQPSEHPTAIDMRRREAWIDRNGPVVIGQRRSEIAIALTRVAPVAEGDPVAGLLVRVRQDRIAASDLTTGIGRVRAIRAELGVIGCRGLRQDRARKQQEQAGEWTTHVDLPIEPA